MSPVDHELRRIDHARNPTMTTSSPPLGNAKGKLLEFCARAKLLPPTLAVERSGERWGVSMTLVIQGGGTLETHRHWGHARAAAEQRAAQELLDELATHSEAEPGEVVTEEEEAAHRLENPKGKLLERCTVLRVTASFDVHPVLTRDGQGFEASVSVTLPNGEEVWSEIRRARSAKAAEQAAAASLLPQVLAASAAPPTTLPPLSIDARSTLNELRSRGGLRDYGFTLERVEGPPHKPIFHMRAFALRSNGERVDVASVTAASKKEAERLAAERLYAELHDRR